MRRQRHARRSGSRASGRHTSRTVPIEGACSRPRLPGSRSFTSVSNACAAATRSCRDAFLYCRWIFRRLCRLDLSVGRSSRCGSTSPRCGNRVGVVFCGAQDFRTLHECRRASEASASASTRSLSDADSVANFRYELVTRAPVGSVVRPNSRGRTVPLRTTNSAAQVDASPRAARNTAVGSLVATR
jgi:hypothetical protein